jgi:hypothetical protein
MTDQAALIGSEDARRRLPEALGAASAKRSRPSSRPIVERPRAESQPRQTVANSQRVFSADDMK